MRKRNLVFAVVGAAAPFLAVGPSATACVLHNPQDDVQRAAPLTVVSDGAPAGVPFFEAARASALSP
jgi:hypothetical protein